MAVYNVVDMQNIKKKFEKEYHAGLDGPQNDQVGWRGYLNPTLGSQTGLFL